MSEKFIPNVETEKNTTDTRIVSDDDLMVLRTENLVKKYGQRTVANHVSINVKQGEIVGLLGTERSWKDHDFLYDYRFSHP